MAEPFVGEIRAFGFGYAPRGWAQCNGQTLSIAQNQALFAILGITYGGDGVRTFALPDLRGRTGVHAGNGIALGGSGGEEGHTLTVAEIPAHTHGVNASSGAAAVNGPANALWASSAANPYGASPDVAMNPAAIAAAGTGEAHGNMQPYLVANYCIALLGIFPTRD